VTSMPTPRWTWPRRPSAGGTAPARARRCRRSHRWRPARSCWPTGPDRSVLGSAGPAGGGAHPPRPRRAAVGQPRLRRLLLVPVGGEHPRGQGLHLQPALGRGALDRRILGDPRRRRGHRRHRRRAAGDLVRAGPAGHRSRPARTSSSRPGSTPSARSCWACRPSRGWPAWPARTPATACGSSSSPSTRSDSPRPTREDVSAAAASYLAPARAATVILGDADLSESSLATLSTVERGHA
jgi:hypothetical protein